MLLNRLGYSPLKLSPRIFKERINLYQLPGVISPIHEP